MLITPASYMHAISGAPAPRPTGHLPIVPQPEGPAGIHLSPRPGMPGGNTGIVPPWIR